MNKLYRKVLLALVDEGMKTHMPEFRHEKFDKHPLRNPSNREFLWKPDEQTRIYINVRPHPSGWDDFQCEISWSRLDRYPAPELKIYGPEHFHEDEGWVVLNHFGKLPNSWKIERVNVPAPATPVEEFDDYRGLTEQEALQLISPMVAEMFTALGQYGRQIIGELAANKKANA